MKNLNGTKINLHISINITDLRRHGAIGHGKSKSGVIEWVQDGQLEARIQYKSYVAGDDNSYLRLKYTINETDHHDYTIALSRTAMHFGGYRYWFHCPETDKRVTTLYLEPKDGRFLSRYAIGALYPSQLETDYDRALAMRKKYADKLRGAALVKPKGMHTSTYEKLLDKYKHYNGKAIQIMSERMERYQDRFA